ncbi:hypothetical protein CEP52_009510 [Fusarium oligoseptatum]|uniref:Xylanolytic transcriptional activator regulatory domain-containing protein n=1 Tax=Fusarium oligoseptatum TaxID=2604345 RepID=A0A428TCQ3_9HYPO|nr:hypothetical protein CEP52_009510 [Fusarium oligoseptatum]
MRTGKRKRTGDRDDFVEDADRGPRRAIDDASTIISASSVGPQDTDALLALANTATRTPSSCVPRGSLPSHYSRDEDDGPLQTLCRMSNGEAVVLSPDSTGQAEQPVRRIFEYYSDFNALTVLNDAIGQQGRRRRLVQIDLDEPPTSLLTRRELGPLDEVDRAYLAQRRVHDLPSRSSCESMLQLFFKHVFPYTPVVDRVQVVSDFNQYRCSTFLIYSMFSITVPYASDELIHAMSFGSVIEAQRTFFTRARLLFDFGCERSQLNLLQGCILLSSFQNSFAPDKDYRFWFNNATHMATRMGLHRRNIEHDLDTATHRVCRRIWWQLFQRDVMFSLAGFENARKINDDEVDAVPLHEDDWIEAQGDEAVRLTLPVITKVQVHFMIENSQLAKIGARCIKFLRGSDASQQPSNAGRVIGDEILSWRKRIPPELRGDAISEADEPNVWGTVLLTFSYRLECLLYRALRRRARETGSDDFTWANQRLNAALFELNMVLRRAMALEMLSAAPPSMIVCVTQLMALQIEMALEEGCPRGKKQALKAEIHIILSYCKDMEHKWMNAKWASTVFEWVARHTGMLLVGPSTLDSHNDRQHSGDDRFQNQGQLDLGDMSDLFPDNWVQDMIDQGVLAHQDQAMFEILGVPF